MSLCLRFAILGSVYGESLLLSFLALMLVHDQERLPGVQAVLLPYLNHASIQGPSCPSLAAVAS